MALALENYLTSLSRSYSNPILIRRVQCEITRDDRFLILTAGTFSQVVAPDVNFRVELVLGTGDIAQTLSNKLANTESSAVLDLLDQPKIYYGMGLDNSPTTLSISGSSIININSANCRSVR